MKKIIILILVNILSVKIYSSDFIDPMVEDIKEQMNLKIIDYREESVIESKLTDEEYNLLLLKFKNNPENLNIEELHSLRNHLWQNPVIIKNTHEIIKQYPCIYDYMQRRIYNISNDSNSISSIKLHNYFIEIHKNICIISEINSRKIIDSIEHVKNIDYIEAYIDENNNISSIMIISNVYTDKNTTKENERWGQLTLFEFPSNLFISIKRKDLPTFYIERSYKYLHCKEEIGTHAVNEMYFIFDLEALMKIESLIKIKEKEKRKLWTVQITTLLKALQE